MSGGSYEYFFDRLNDFADKVRHNNKGSPPHLAFAALCRRIAKAAHDIEWVESCDYGSGDDLPAIRAVINSADEVNAAIDEATKALALLEQAIARAREPKP